MGFVTKGPLALALLVISSLVAACAAPGVSGVLAPLAPNTSPNLPLSEVATPASSTPPTEPLVLPAGIDTRLLMQGTPQETTLYVVGTGQPGPVVLVLGGVHGNEPGGWLAAEQIMEMPFDRGSLLVVPRANRLATYLYERTTPDLGDLNRLYPGDPEGLPMARMAHEIVGLVEEFRVNVLIDLHESWGFYNGRTVGGTAFLGQTVSAYPNEVGPPLAEAIVGAVNQKTIYSWEELFYREFPPRNNPTATTGGSRSSLGVGLRYPGVAAILVEMGQQQSLERRIALHVHVVDEALWLLGMRG